MGTWEIGENSDSREGVEGVWVKGISLSPSYYQSTTGVG